MKFVSNQRETHAAQTRKLQTSCRGKFYWADVGLELHVIMLTGSCLIKCQFKKEKKKSKREKHLQERSTARRQTAFGPAFPTAGLRRSSLKSHRDEGLLWHQETSSRAFFPRRTMSTALADTSARKLICRQCLHADSEREKKKKKLPATVPSRETSKQKSRVIARVLPCHTLAQQVSCFSKKKWLAVKVTGHPSFFSFH